MVARLLAALAALALSACAGFDRPGPGSVVRAAAETAAVGTANADAADDPAIWIAGSPVVLAGVTTPGFIAGTDKKAGLYIYGLDGAVLQFLPEGLLNNVDLAATNIDDRGQVIIGASDRTPGRAGVSLFRYDYQNGGEVVRWGHIQTDLVEPYGFCMRQIEGTIHALVIGKDGEVRHLTIAADAQGQPVATELRRFAIGSISEGCAIDVLSNTAFIGEELVGVWRYSMDPARGDARELIQGVDGVRLRADVEGVTLIDDGFDAQGAVRYLMVSSQGDSAFAVWRIGRAAEPPVWIGRFAVHGGPGGDEVTGTDGLDAHGGPSGPFPEGLVVVQDDVNDNGPQNFKILDWRDIKAALGLP